MMMEITVDLMSIHNSALNFSALNMMISTIILIAPMMVVIAVDLMYMQNMDVQKELFTESLLSESETF